MKLGGSPAAVDRTWHRESCCKVCEPPSADVRNRPYAATKAGSYTSEHGQMPANETATETIRATVLGASASS